MCYYMCLISLPVCRYRKFTPILSFQDIFKLIVSIFAELADTASPHFSRRVKILETIARCKCCVIMLDIDCNDLVLETFNTFFSVVRWISFLSLHLLYWKFPLFKLLFWYLHNIHTRIYIYIAVTFIMLYYSINFLYLLRLQDIKMIKINNYPIYKMVKFQDFVL